MFKKFNLNFFSSHCRSAWQSLTTPISRREDDARREYILCVLLVLLSGLAIIFTFSVKILDIVIGTPRSGISWLTSIIIAGLFLGLLYATRQGQGKFSAYAFLGLVTIPTLYSLTRWGTLLPIPLLTLGLIIVMTGILIHSRAATIMAVGVGSYLGLINYAHQHRLLSVDSSWMRENLYPNYSLEIMTVLLVISGVTWLAHRELEYSLRRMRRSETLLKKERDTLEEKVIARTQELERAQWERLKEISRFVEIGKLSAELMHDLVNPLTTINLQIERLAELDSSIVNDTRVQIDHITAMTKRFSHLIDRIRNELSGHREQSLVQVNDLIKRAIEAVQHTANQNNTEIIFSTNFAQKIEINPIHFHRALTNILLNAIDACSLNPTPRPRLVTIEFRVLDGKNIISVTDTGIGIEPDHLAKIFTPFFTTKNKLGIGLGLSIAQELFAQEMQAVITVTSRRELGTTFNIVWS